MQLYSIHLVCSTAPALAFHTKLSVPLLFSSVIVHKQNKVCLFIVTTSYSYQRSYLLQMDDPVMCTTKSKTGSHPNLAFITSDPDQISLRKRKIPDSEKLIMNELKQELTMSLDGFRRELSDTLKEFQESMMSSFECILKKQTDNIKQLHEEFGKIKSDVTKIQKSNDKLQRGQTQLTSDFKQLQKDNENLNEYASRLEKRIDSTNVLVSEISEQLRNKEQEGRRNNLEISGVPLTKDENLSSILHRLSVKVGFPLTSGDVDYIHRVKRYLSQQKITNGNDKTVPGKTPVPNIIVRFTQRRRKSELLAAIRARRGITTADLDFDGASSPVYVSDHLTPHYKLLYRRVREQAKQLDFKFVWLNDCKIFIRKSEASKVIIIANEADLAKIK